MLGVSGVGGGGRGYALGVRRGPQPGSAHRWKAPGPWTPAKGQGPAGPPRAPPKTPPPRLLLRTHHLDLHALKTRSPSSSTAMLGPPGSASRVLRSSRSPSGGAVPAVRTRPRARAPVAPPPAPPTRRPLAGDAGGGGDATPPARSLKARRGRRRHRPANGAIPAASLVEGEEAGRGGSAHIPARGAGSVSPKHPRNHTGILAGQRECRVQAGGREQDGGAVGSSRRGDRAGCCWGSWQG